MSKTKTIALEMIPPGSLPKKNHRDPKSEFFVRNDGDNRPARRPDGAEIPGPPYRVNYAALQLADQSLGNRPRLAALETVHFLTQKIQDPTFHLEPICRTCETWVPAKLKPSRKGALDNLQGCNGCVYSLLDGSEGGDFANTDRDAAFSAWANAKAQVRELELQRSAATGVQKERLAARVAKAWLRVKRTAKRCQRLGFTPVVPLRVANDEWMRPLIPQTRHQRRKDTEKNFKREVRTERRLVSPSCRNCRNWEHDEKLSGPQGTFGNCWVSGGVTKASTWCEDHNNPK